jgi:hypothetical protein
MAVALTTRTGLIVVAALAVGWVSGSMSQSPAPAQQSIRGNGSTGPRPLGSNTVPRAEKLREQLKEPPLPSRGRNPFVYGSRRSVPAIDSGYRDRAEEPMSVPMAAPIPEAPRLPVFRLSGIASTTQDGTAVLTAILIDNGSMVFAKAGDKLSNGYSVVRVEETSVTLIDSTGVTQTIRLP